MEDSTKRAKTTFWADDLAALPREDQVDPPSLQPLSPLLPSFRFPPPSPCWNKDVRAAFLLVYVSLPYTLFYSAQFAIKTREYIYVVPIDFLTFQVAKFYRRRHIAKGYFRAINLVYIMMPLAS